MARRLLRAPNHDRNRSLGWLAVWWMETFTVRGPGDAQGMPVRYVDEFVGFIVDCYALDERGRRLYSSVFFSRPKGCDKSGLGANFCLFEALGPCRFAGWAEGGETYTFLGQTYTYSAGEPMGQPVTAPFVRVMATEEDQTGNVYGAIHFNLTDDDAPLSQLKAYGLDPGLTRVMLPEGGEIRPSTSGSASKDGGLESFVCFDESHLYNTPVLRQMYRTVSQNLPKRGRSAEPWAYEPTTMYAPGEESVAEETYRYADMIQAGKARRARLLFDHRWADLEVEQLGDEESLRKAIEEAYGDALEWNSVEDVIDKIFDPRIPPQNAIRYYLNGLSAKRNAWVQPAQWNACRADEDLQDGDVITLGFDGSESHDATALVACRVSDRLLVPLLIDEEPDGPEAKNWIVDREAFDAKVAEAFERFRVVGFFADPPFWQDYLDKWFREFGDQLLVASTQKHPIYFWTKNDVPMSQALERLHTAIVTGQVKWSTRSRFARALSRHVENAQNWVRRGGNVIGKEAKASPLKIDAAMAATLAYEAAAAWTTRGKPLPVEAAAFVPFRVR